MHRHEASGENLLAGTVAFVAVALGEAAGSGVLVEAGGHPCGILPVGDKNPVPLRTGEQQREIPPLLRRIEAVTLTDVLGCPISFLRYFVRNAGSARGIPQMEAASFPILVIVSQWADRHAALRT
jgi:hypothetical protein